MWYGGLQWQKKAPKYADYYSCAFVRISGGDALTSSYTAKFQPNPKPKTGALSGVPLDKCASGSIRPNQCGGDACESGPIMNTVPQEFQGGNSQKVSSKLFGGGGVTMADADDAPAPAAVVADTIQADMQDEKEDEAVAEEQTAMEEGTPARELTAKKGAETTATKALEKDSGNGDYLEEIEVIVGGKKVAGIKGGESETVMYKGGGLRLQVATSEEMKSVVIDVSGKGSKTQRNKPYAYVWNSPKMNSPTTISVSATAQDGKKYSMKATVMLSSSSGGGTSNSNSASTSTSTGTTESEPAPTSAPKRSSSNGNSSGYCSRGNIPPMPRGSWGPRGSSKWNQMRNMYRKRYYFCRRCRNVC